MEPKKEFNNALFSIELGELEKGYGKQPCYVCESYVDLSRRLFILRLNNKVVGPTDG